LFAYLEFRHHILGDLQPVHRIPHELDKHIARKVLGVDVDALLLVERVERAWGVEAGVVVEGDGGARGGRVARADVEPGDERGEELLKHGGGGLFHVQVQ
jgi:hypothetical protein